MKIAGELNKGQIFRWRYDVYAVKELTNQDNITVFRLGSIHNDKFYPTASTRMLENFNRYTEVEVGELVWRGR